MSNELQIVERSPKNEVAFGKQAATALMDIVREQKLARKFGGDKEHLYVEAWELLGQFTGLSAGSEAEPIEIDGIKGAKGKAIIRDKDGNVVGEAVALCLRDEPNWKNKPFFQLMSMAQTRAVSKAYRIRLGWIAVLAGYSGTPAEEMDGVHAAPTPVSSKKVSPSASGEPKQDIKEPSLAEMKSRAIAAAKKVGFEVDDLEGWLEVKQDEWGKDEIARIRQWYRDQVAKKEAID